MIKRLSLVLLLIGLAGCATTKVAQKTATTDLPYQDMTLVAPKHETVTLSVQVASTAQEQADGLMFRERLGANEGMVFSFGRPQQLTFWMKNTLIPLDVIYFDENGWFVSSQTMVPCDAEPCPTYPSAKPALYALEVNPGFAIEHGIGEGWRIRQD